MVTKSKGTLSQENYDVAIPWGMYCIAVGLDNKYGIVLISYTPSSKKQYFPKGRPHYSIIILCIDSM